MKSIYYYYLF